MPLKIKLTLAVLDNVTKDFGDREFKTTAAAWDENVEEALKQALENLMGEMFAVKYEFIGVEEQRLRGGA